MPKINMSPVLAAFGGSKRESIPCLSLAFSSPWCSLVYRWITPVSASVFTWPSSLSSFSYNDNSFSLDLKPTLIQDNCMSRSLT